MNCNCRLARKAASLVGRSRRKLHEHTGAYAQFLEGRTLAVDVGGAFGQSAETMFFRFIKDKSFLTKFCLSWRSSLASKSMQISGILSRGPEQAVGGREAML
jgi:hypothetical protein